MLLAGAKKALAAALTGYRRGLGNIHRWATAVYETLENQTTLRGWRVERGESAWVGFVLCLEEGMNVPLWES